MKLRNLISVIMNRSEFAGYNWLNVSLALPILIGMIYIGYLASVSENGLVTVLIGIAIFFLIIVFIMWLVNQITLLALGIRIGKGGERILDHVYGSFIFNPDVNLKGLTLPDTNRFMIDVIITYTSNRNISFSPTINYTKQPLVKIPLSKVKGVEVKSTTILRQTGQESRKLNESMATAAGSTGVYLPVGDIQDSLDKSLPLKKFHLEIMTDDESYQFLMHEKTMENQVVKKLTDMVVSV